MAGHLARIAALTLVITACMFLPYLPGRYDGLAVTLSVMAQAAGVVGLLLVPLAAAWLIYEVRASKRHTPPRLDRGYYFAIASLTASAIVALAVAGAAATTLGISLGVGVLAAWIFGAWRLARRLAALKHPVSRRFNPVPLYILMVPVVAAVIRFSLLDRAADFSRERAMSDSAAVLTDIEKYHAVHGQYPTSLLALWTDYEPTVVGIPQFHYERSGDAYNIYFEQLSTIVGTREIVMYNKRDEHHLPSHDSDILLWTPEQLRARRGYYAVRDASRSHWKRLLFD
jgi:hypothetical protein